ncbi:hypothetical protein PC116_g31635 [Phytophthora cactorum]|nr:hypothetical protein PC116_g31635 [Phytophthora cactorum]
MVKILDNLLDLPVPSDVTDDPNRVAEELEESETLALPTKTKGKKGKGKGNINGDQEKKPSSRRKPLLATYEPDKRLDSWLKVKKDYSSSFDTLDLVPVAAWHGQGRKAKWWSPILMAVRNDGTGTLDVVCKCMSGFTDAFYKANKKFYNDGTDEEPLDPNDVKQSEEKDGKSSNEADEDDSRKYNNVRKTKPSFVEYSGPEPDVWFEPQEVWEMAFADITLSPTYTAAIGLVSQERGLSLRFPRFLRKREDKGIEEASSSEFLAALYRKQEAKAPIKEEVEEGDEDEL